MFYLIGGIARSGKSTARRQIASQVGISGIETDVLRTVFELIDPKLKISHFASPKHNQPLMRRFLDAFIKARLYFDEDYVLEGDVLTPEWAKPYCTEGIARAVFIGFPNISHADKYKQLTENKDGWIAGLQKDSLLRYVDSWIDESSDLEKQCRIYEMPFLDASLLTLPEVVTSILELLKLKTRGE